MAIDDTHPTLAPVLTNGRRWSQVGWLPLTLLAVTLTGFLLAPWPLPVKLYALVHGLCAQRPSHSFSLGGTRLPFDARMTGIYGGFLLATGYLLARGRWRAGRLPSLPMLITLGLFVTAMGLDGINSTLQDFHLPYLYAPDNRLRLFTGQLMGIVLATILLTLLNQTLWAQNDERPVLAGARDLPLLLALQVGFFGVVISGWGGFYLPVALGLALSAVLAAGTLVLALLVLTLGRENRCTRSAELAGLASVALLLAYVALALLASGRFLLERFIDTSRLT